MNAKNYLKKQKSNFLLWYARKAYRGTGRICPVCGKTSRKFLAFGIPKREDAMCPMCCSLERHRLLMLFLTKKFAFFSNPPARMLHYAPEAQLSRVFREAVGRGYTTTDLMDPAVDVAADIRDLPFGDGSFDFVLCSHVLEHIPDDRKAMAENLRILKRGGRAIFMVPLYDEPTVEDPLESDPEERTKRFGQHDHVRKYGPDMAGRLATAGFSVESVYKEDFLTEGECAQFGLRHAFGSGGMASPFHRDCIFWCRK